MNAFENTQQTTINHTELVKNLDSSIRIMHKTMEETKGVPAIMMSATLPTNELQQRGIYALRKPMDIGNVIRMITHALATFEEQYL